MATQALPIELLPPKVATYVQTGAPMGTLGRDLSTVSNQIPRLGWAAIAAGAGWVAYKRYKARKKGSQS